MKKHIPNFVTLLSLFCGCIGIIQALEGNLQEAKMLLWLGAFFDFMDGLAARALKATSDIGKQLDSLCDMVTFGVLPGIMMYVALSNYVDQNSIYQSYLPYSAFIFSSFIALRLAKFNIDTTQGSSFRGIPSPAGGIFIASITTVEVSSSLSYFSFIFFNPFILIAVSIIISLLLVSNIRFMAFKMRGFGKFQGKLQYIILIMSLIMVVLFQNEGIIMSLTLYIISSIFSQKSMRSKV